MRFVEEGFQISRAKLDIHGCEDIGMGCCSINI